MNAENPHHLNIRCTSSAELDEFQVGDNTVELIGAIIEVEPQRQVHRANAGESRNIPLRMILTNNAGRKMRILFWEGRIAEFQNKIDRKYIHIKRARVSQANITYYKPAKGLLKIETSIQPYTAIEILGDVDVEVTPREINFAEINLIEGPIITFAYINMKFEGIVNANKSAAYGSGALTDGVYRLPVQVTVFVEAESPNVGRRVLFSRISMELCFFVLPTCMIFKCSMEL